MNKPIQRVLAAAVLAAAAGLAAAQDDKTIAVEPVPAFNQWITTVIVVVPETPVANVQAVSIAPPAAAAAGTDYQPRPVIVGLPELPLVGAGAAQAARTWGPELNYQGVFMRQVVLDARGAKREVRPMAAHPKPGERFKIRVTATFDAVADVDLVAGGDWGLRRLDQFYPKKGLSVQIKAGETIELPVGPNEYFVATRPNSERIVVSVRHPQALGDARSTQPAYRQDGRQGSSYLQLVPKGSYPVVEQLITPAP